MRISSAEILEKIDSKTLGFLIGEFQEDVLRAFPDAELLLRGYCDPEDEIQPDWFEIVIKTSSEDIEGDIDKHLQLAGKLPKEFLLVLLYR